LRFDFVVVGSGIAGLSTAYLAAVRGYRVALVGIPELMSMVAGSSSGILTYHMPSPFLEWSLETLGFYEELSGGVVERVPCIWMSRDASFVDYVASRVREGGVRIRLASSDTLKSMGVDIQFFEGEIVTLGDGFRIMVGKLLDVLTSRFVELGGAIVRGWGYLEGSRVRVGGEVVEGDSIVVAAGAWSRELLGLNNTIVYKCQAVRLEEPRVDYIVIDDTTGFYANLAQDGTLALGDGIKVVVKEPEEALKADKWVIEEVIRRAQKRGLIAGYKVAYTVSAPCLGTADTYPLVGEVRDGIYVVTALDGVGFSIAPALAKLLLDSITKGARIPEQLRPDREIEGGEPREPID